jgi:hypothetical protein
MFSRRSRNAPCHRRGLHAKKLRPGPEDPCKSVVIKQKSGATVTMPLKTQFYGVKEFAFEDPEGWVITIAERIK